jgi:hypothetical protein
LDQYLTDHQLNVKKVKFIKIDIEGYEYVALRGALSLLEHVPFLLCEFSPDYMKRGGIEARDLLKLMERYHYRPHTISDRQLSPLTSEEILGFTHNVNIFWIKEGQQL